jgi:iron complex outermembrane recepter protein
MKKSNFIVFLSLTLCANLLAQEVELGVIKVEATDDTEILEETITKKSSSLAKEAKGETLGDFLQAEQFVDSASYGPAVGRPVVRGMDGYRVGITNGNIILNDLSSMSQDHAVGVMPRASEKIELIKGPSSLLYGNYSGGVIRVVGEEHNAKLLKPGYSLSTVTSYGSNGAGFVAGATLKASDYNLSIDANTFYHEADNYKDGDNFKVKDSDTLSLQSHVVLGYQINKENIVKLYIDELHKDYGIPNSTDKSTTIEMDQERYGLVWHVNNLFDGIKHIQTEIQSSDYLHSELEGGRADGLFGQKQFSLSSSLEFDLDMWDIKANAEYQTSDLQVCHEHGKCTKFFDAQRTSIEDGVELQQNIDKLGLPFAHGHPMPNISESVLKAGVSMSNFINDDSEITLALRGEKRKLTPDNVNIQEVWLVTPAIDPNYYDTIDDYALSASTGFASFVNDIFSYQTSLSYVERLPSSTELFWNGFHHATDSYIFGDRDLENEKSLNLDIDTMLSFDTFTTQVSAFYYHFYNYIFQEPLADANGVLLVDPFHQSDVWAMRGVAAKVYGMAFKESYKKEISAHTLKASMSLEAIRGILSSGENIPRIPTYNATFVLEHLYKGYKANLTYKYVDKSRFEAENETHTPSYNWLSAFISYENKNRFFDYSLYLKGENLTNEIAYNHLSFLKETAPLAGRQLTLGAEIKF